MEVEHGEEVVVMTVAEERGWETPRREECRIPAVPPCPAPPRKKAVAPPELGKERREPPKGGYFQPPDLESLFALAPPRRQPSSCARTYARVNAASVQ